MGMRAILFIAFLFFMILSPAQINDCDRFFESGDYDSAIAAYEKASPSPQRFFKLARVYRSLGALKKSANFYKKGLNLDSLDVRANYEYGQVLYRSERLKESYKVFKQLVNENPDVASYVFNLGLTLSRFEQDPSLTIELEDAQYEDGKSAFAKALKINPDYRTARIELIKVLLRTGDRFEAVVAARNAAEKYPDDIKILSLAAQAAMASRLYPMAVGIFEKLYELNNDTEYNRKSLATAYYYTNELEKSSETFESYLKDYDDSDADVYFMLSKIYTRLDRLTEAEAAISKTIQLNRPALDQEYLQMASIYSLKKDYKNAYLYLKKANKENPASADIAYQLALGADRHFEDKQEILKAYEVFLKNHPESRYTEMAQARASDLKRLIFMDKGK
jgi:tetratricopeptide (TPR) repeat protein